MSEQVEVETPKAAESWRGVRLGQVNRRRRGPHKANMLSSTLRPATIV
jgi:hypothetical protein